MCRKYTISAVQFCAIYLRERKCTITLLCLHHMLFYGLCIEYMEWCIIVINIIASPVSASSNVHFQTFVAFFLVFLVVTQPCAALIREREVRRSVNHKFDWLGDRPSNRLGNVPGAYHVSQVENFKLKRAGQGTTDRLFLQSCNVLHLSQPIASRGTA